MKINSKVEAIEMIKIIIKLNIKMIIKVIYLIVK
jgi:hypothetical protein